MFVEIVQNNAVLSFPKYLLNNQLVQKLIDRIEFETIVLKSIITEQQTIDLSEELNKNWWSLNKEIILKRISDAEDSH